MRKPVAGVLTACLMGSAAVAQGAPAGESARTLITNVRVWDGTSTRLGGATNVLIEGNRIKAISPAAQPDTGTTVIDGGGRTLMPGLIDNHVHFSLTGATLSEIENNMTWEDIAYNAVPSAEMYLMEGFTTVRDAGGTNGGLGRAIDSGLIVGPRMYNSGAFLGGRGGHADFAPWTAPTDAGTNMARLKMSQQVDGVDATLLYARNNFRMGATQLKVMQSGGVVSLFDPWQMNGRTSAEIEAAV